MNRLPHLLVIVGVICIVIVIAPSAGATDTSPRPMKVDAQDDGSGAVVVALENEGFCGRAQMAVLFEESNHDVVYHRA